MTGRKAAEKDLTQKGREVELKLTLFSVFSLRSIPHVHRFGHCSPTQRSMSICFCVRPPPNSLRNKNNTAETSGWHSIKDVRSNSRNSKGSDWSYRLLFYLNNPTLNFSNKDVSLKTKRPIKPPMKFTFGCKLQSHIGLIKNNLLTLLSSLLTLSWVSSVFDPLCGGDTSLFLCSDAASQEYSCF